jgi:hypothetical protein
VDVKRWLRPIAVLGSVAVLAAGCATAPDRPPDTEVLPQLTPFSANPPGEGLPQHWHPWRLSRLKSPSRYLLVDDAGSTVVKANARATASGLIHYVDIDPRTSPLLDWRWKVMDLIPSEISTDDSPVRVVVSFSGDLDKLPFGDRLFYDNFRLFTGQQLPYAALMYVWGSRTPKEGIVPNRYTSRIKILAVENGRDKLGTWQSVTRNVREDFKRAFGEEPGTVISVGILTETEDDERGLEAYYGDIQFRRGCCH